MANFLKPIIIGVVGISVAFGGLLIWSALAPLASAAIAPGVIVVESNRKIVQHPDGGVVREILVRDGDLVASGQILAVLESSRLNLSLNNTREQLAINIANTERLEAERTGQPLAFSEQSLAEVSISQYPYIRRDQEIMYAARRAVIANNLAIAQSERAQAQSILGHLVIQLDAKIEHLRLAERDVSVAQDLARNGAGTERRLNEVRQVATEIRSDIASIRARIAENQARIERATLDESRSHWMYLESVEKDIAAARRERADLIEKIGSLNEQISRLTIRAPVAGRVVNQTISTIGGVVGSGMRMLEIVPAEDSLLIEAQVRPSDIENVRPGLNVEIRILGTYGMNLPRLNGLVSVVSADRLVDGPQNHQFFLVRINFDENSERFLRGHGLRPGVPTETIIYTGDSTMLAYLTSNLTRFFSLAMKE
ncbi:HlyD family type I secretion periplasmic adaptor subunit [Roseomonas sp. NAR14]|uniref:Membrane fusion protein (MFP) family protein n=1 Tax=Roseomonas acroporae TaxID=2937791 RepID=A0A9X2BY83_9PROT|nr:HlyD family type I secretion periplasmic adaptor subunit [Roseomonas acroporae]MCK8788111.1 HlyD family type I secretion periplasmic adaptor subunit [Roseomonas acroporae]